MTVEADLTHDGAVLRVRFANGKGNILDAGVCQDLMGVLGEAADRDGLLAVVLEGEGRHFSFGASVQEHTPAEVGAMLPRFHALIRRLVHLDVLTVAMVRGQCLGGGLEVAAACSVILCDERGAFGQPEIKLGVIAPAGSVLLPARVAPAVAEDLLLTGRSIDAAEAHRIGLVNAIVDDPDTWLAEHVLGKSAAALKFALHAVRSPLRDAVDRRLDWVERLYLEDLMATHDAAEGIAAFLERRKPQWTHR